MTDWLKIAKDAYGSSTSYVDANYRKNWDADLRAFHSQHPAGSKYLSDSFKNRSKGFRPKTRSIIRKNEAAAAVALFSNVDVVNVDPVNPDDVQSVANAFISKELMQYRLTKTMPWFKLSLGAFQEAMTIGVVCSYQYWKYDADTKKVDVPGAMNEDGSQAQQDQTTVLEDEPCIEMRPVENIRIHPASDWLDPINKSPYLIDMIPMFAGEVKRMASVNDPKTNKPKWKKLDDAELRMGCGDPNDSTRMQREPGRQDPTEAGSGDISDFEIVWVFRCFIRKDGKHVVYYTLKDAHLLSEPEAVTECYPHLERDKRPYVMGISVIESQRPVPGGLARLAAPLQQDANEISNERRDNVKLVLNKRYAVARGKQVDIDGLVRNVPGSVVMMNDTQLDVREMTWPDVTQSAYVEQDRINGDLDELVGNFSGATRQANTAMNDTLGGAKLGHQTESMMQEYVLRTWIESWCEPVLQQLLALEQEYESDAMVIALAAQKAKLWQKFGISQVTDELLRKQLTLTVNVGMGSTNPQQKLQKFMAATETAIKLTTEAPPGFNVAEAIKEVYSMAGMRDGARFFPEGGNPQVQKLMQALQQMQGELKSKQASEQMDAQLKQMQIQSNERIAGGKLMVDKGRIDGDLQLRQQELTLQNQQLMLENSRLQAEAQGKSAEFQARFAQMQMQLQETAQTLQLERERMGLERERMQMEREQHAAELGSTEIDQQHKVAELDNKRAEIDIKNAPVKENAAVVAKVTTQLETVARELAGVKDELAQPEAEPVAATWERDANGAPITAVIEKSDGKKLRIAYSG